MGGKEGEEGEEERKVKEEELGRGRRDRNEERK